MGFVTEFRSWLESQRTSAADALAKLQRVPTRLADADRTAAAALAEIEAIHRILDDPGLPSFESKEPTPPRGQYRAPTLAPSLADTLTPGKPLGRPTFDTPSSGAPSAPPPDFGAEPAAPHEGTLTPGGPGLLGLRETPTLEVEDWRRALRTRTPRPEDFGIDPSLDLGAPLALAPAPPSPARDDLDVPSAEFRSPRSSTSPVMPSPARRLDWEDARPLDPAQYAALPNYVRAGCSETALAALVAALRREGRSELPEDAVYAAAAARNVEGPVAVLALLATGIVTKQGATLCLR